MILAASCKLQAASCKLQAFRIKLGTTESSFNLFETDSISSNKNKIETNSARLFMSDDHFKGKYEVELKFRLTSKSAFLDVLKTIPHEVMFEDNLETDCYFDTPDKALQAENKSLCIRTIEPSGINLWIVKGPEADHCEASNITDAKRAKSMLNTMGYEMSLEAIKTRSIYFVHKYHITVDSLADIGDFAEFAIMTNEENKLAGYKQELLELADRFGLSEADLEFKSYKELFFKSQN